MRSDRRYRRGQAGEHSKGLGRSSPQPEQSALAERSGLVRELRQLPTKQAAALVMRHYHGYSNRKIAAALGVAEQTVASRLAAARKQLQVTLGDLREPKMVDPA